MKKIFIIVFALATAYLSSQDLNVMTYNIKYDKVEDTINNWHDRKESLVKLMDHYQASFIGTQEVLHHQLMYIDSALTEFAYIGVGRNDGKQKGEYAPIHYDSTRYKVLKQNTFWLSETPEEVSTGWDASLARICTYGLFEEKETHEKIWVFNTHFDHRGIKAREESVRLIVAKIKILNTNNLPVVLMGDLNLQPTESPIQYLQAQLIDGQTATMTPFYGPTGTFTGFDANMVINRRIDYIFVQGCEVLNYLHIDDRMENNKHISDHLPILARITINK